MSQRSNFGIMKKGAVRVAGIAIVTLLQSAVSVEAIEPDRGQLLYENHCLKCHQSTVHIREDRRARSVDDIKYQITRWQNVLGLQWDTEDIDHVLQYLNRRFYLYEPRL